MKLSISTNTPVFQVSIGDELYQLAFPLSSIIKAEEMLGGRSLRGLRDWLKLEPKDFPAILECGLLKFHPDSAREIADKITSSLGSEEFDELHHGLCCLCFPRSMSKVEEMQKQSSAAEDKSPNEQ